MNKVGIILVFLIECTVMKSQSTTFKVDCGNDTAFCYGLNAKITNYIGTEVQISNGIAPYKYSWNCKKVFYLNGYLTAKDLLNDTSILNPILNTWPIPSTKFYLTVIDDVGNKTTDSINVKFSQFRYATGVSLVTINKGDSIQYGTIIIGGGISPVKYYWSPSSSVADSTAITTWFKPKLTTSYYQYVIDSAGCKSASSKALDVEVLDTPIKNLEKPVRSMYQSGSILFFDNPKNQLAKLSFYSMEGKELYSIETQAQTFETRNIPFINTANICVLKVDGKQQSCKFIRVY